MTTENNKRLKEKIKNIPKNPGIYKFFNTFGKLLYIGKAKSLKNRVKSYFGFQQNDLYAASNLSYRIHKMISETTDIEYIVVESEHDALILENSLIKQLKPKYNILLRDDKTYPYMYIDTSKKFPRFEITREVIKGRGIKYFGPFSSGMKQIYDSIYDIFPLVQKRGCLKKKKACLFYQIKKCPAPCEDKISEKEYALTVESVINVLNNKKLLIKLLKDKMTEYSKKQLYEQAAKTRDTIEKIERSLVLSEVDLAKKEDIDIFAIKANQNKACVVRMFIRNGKVVSSSHSFFKSDYGFDLDELYKRSLIDFYMNDLNALVKKVLVYDDFADRESVEEILSQKFEKKSQIIHPKIGNKRKLTSLAIKNAEELLRLENKQNSDEILHALKSLLNLEKTPYSIEIYDNSHLQGDAPTGSYVYWEEGFQKNKYRHYNLNSKDEYSQMSQTLKKRCESFEKNPPPDLWIIDGGKTLLNLTRDIVSSSGADIDIIAISKQKQNSKTKRAKGKALDVIHAENKSYHLDADDKRLQFIQKLRDEAHRFTISFHRKQKLKKDKQIALLEKKGIGKAKVKKLIDYFDTFKNIQNASKDDIEKIIGKQE